MGLEPVSGNSTWRQKLKAGAGNENGRMRVSHPPASTSEGFQSVIVVV